MNKTVLLTATVQSHICQFHKPLVQMLHDSGYQVHVAARDNLAEKNGLKLDFVDKVFDVPFDRSPLGKSNVTAYKILKKIIDSGEYEFIHTNTPAAGVVTRIAAKKARKRGTTIIYTAHGFHFYEGAPKKNWLIYYPIEKYCAKLTDKLITITNEDYILATEKFKTNVYHIHGVGVNSKRIQLLSDEEKNEIKHQLGYDNLRLILNVGELLPNKNQKTVILAMKKVIKEYPSSKLLVAGNGPEHDNLQNLINENGLSHNVELLGYTTEINKYMNIADCVVACSFREGLPLNVMEAMLCGKPVIASNNRGHRELVIDGQTGYIVDADNVNDFSKRIVQVLNSPEKYKINAIKTVEPFEDKNVYSELNKVYFN